MRFDRLTDWLAWQEQLHPREIELGLERITRVLRRMHLEQPAPLVVSVAGTNGKGSVVAMLETIYGRAGYRVGAYTSPHLLRYNERVRVAARPATDDELMAAFDAVDRARGDTSLTYFEFGTLAALEIFRRQGVEIALLEVGLGGRLDAVNAVASDVAAVTNIGIDHVDYLGPDRESIGREKAGIFRHGRPAVCGDPEPPATLLEHAESVGTQLYRVGRDFGVDERREVWLSRGGPGDRQGTLPADLDSAVQRDNAAIALQILACLGERAPVSDAAIRDGLESASLPGRLTRLPGAVEQVFDVAHNGAAAAALAAELARMECRGATRTVLAMLENKPVEAVARALAPETDCWYLAGLTGARALSAARLDERIRAHTSDGAVQRFSEVRSAYRQAMADAEPGDRIVVAGSFLTVAAALGDSAAAADV